MHTHACVAMRWLIDRSSNFDKGLIVQEMMINICRFHLLTWLWVLGSCDERFHNFLDILLSNHSIYRLKKIGRLISCSPTCVIMCFILPVFCAFLQRVMRPVWWTASWKPYSPEQPSAIGENGHHATVMQQQGFHVPLYNCCCFCPPVLYLATFSYLSHRSSFALWFVFH